MGDSVTVLVIPVPIPFPVKPLIPIPIPKWLKISVIPESGLSIFDLNKVEENGYCITLYPF